MEVILWIKIQTCKRGLVYQICFTLLKNGLRPIIISVVFFGILAGIYAYSIAQEEYRSNVDVYITPITESQTSSSDYTVARYLIMTGSRIF